MIVNAGDREFTSIAYLPACELCYAALPAANCLLLSGKCMVQDAVLTSPNLCSGTYRMTYFALRRHSCCSLPAAGWQVHGATCCAHSAKPVQ
jgi:hypothetical protein